jgi:hypothetical protein
VFSVRWELNFFNSVVYNKFVVRKVTSNTVLTRDYTRRNAYATYQTSLLGVWANHDPTRDHSNKCKSHLTRTCAIHFCTSAYGRNNSRDIVSITVNDVLVRCFNFLLLLCVGRDSSVGTATRYGLDGPGIESRWQRGFPHLYRPVLWPTQPPIQLIPGLSRG